MLSHFLQWSWSCNLSLYLASTAFICFTNLKKKMNIFISIYSFKYIWLYYMCAFIVHRSPAGSLSEGRGTCRRVKTVQSWVSRVSLCRCVPITLWQTTQSQSHHTFISCLAQSKHLLKHPESQIHSLIKNKVTNIVRAMDPSFQTKVNKCRRLISSPIVDFVGWNDTNN